MTKKEDPNERRLLQRLVKDASGAYVKNVSLAIQTYGHDEDFIPTAPCTPTTAKPGSAEKIEVLCERVRLGQPLWHPDDEVVLAHPVPASTCTYHQVRTRIGHIRLLEKRP